MNKPAEPLAPPRDLAERPRPAGRARPGEFRIGLAALLVTLLTVHGFYALHVRPVAQALLERAHATRLADPTYVAPRSLYVLVMDYEQEVEFVLVLWAFALAAVKWRAQLRERLGPAAALPAGGFAALQPCEAAEQARRIEALPDEQRELLAPRAAIAALARFGATHDIAAAADAAHAVCSAESDRLESEMSMLRYIAWAIPAIGFVGTLRGIGDALSRARAPLVTDIFAVSEGLGVAFNATVLALVLSILLMFVLHQLQLLQERLVLDTGTFLDQRLIRHLAVP
jgi:biopolymer transport protein ExbB/TolQ